MTSGLAILAEQLRHVRTAEECEIARQRKMEAAAAGKEEEAQSMKKVPDGFVFDDFMLQEQLVKASALHPALQSPESRYFHFRFFLFLRRHSLVTETLTF